MTRKNEIKTLQQAKAQLEQWPKEPRNSYTPSEERHFWNLYMLGVDFAQIAEVFGITIKAVEDKKNRIISGYGLNPAKGQTKQVTGVRWPKHIYLIQTREGKAWFSDKLDRAQRASRTPQEKEAARRENEVVTKMYHDFGERIIPVIARYIGRSVSAVNRHLEDMGKKNRPTLNYIAALESSPSEAPKAKNRSNKQTPRSLVCPYCGKRFAIDC